MLPCWLSPELELGWPLHKAEVPSTEHSFLLCQWGQEGQSPHLGVQVIQLQQEGYVSSVSMLMYRGMKGIRRKLISDGWWLLPAAGNPRTPTAMPSPPAVPHKAGGPWKWTNALFPAELGWRE